MMNTYLITFLITFALNVSTIGISMFGTLNIKVAIVLLCLALLVGIVIPIKFSNNTSNKILSIMLNPMNYFTLFLLFSFIYVNDFSSDKMSNLSDVLTMYSNLLFP